MIARATLLLLASTTALAAGACDLPGRSFPPSSAALSEGRPQRTVTAPMGEAGDEDFRAAPPPRTKTAARALPPPTDARLSNGARIVLLERHDFPSVSAVLLLDRGSTAAPPGVVHTYSQAMVGESAEYKAGEAFEYLRFVGGRVDGYAYHDSLGLQTTALSPLFVSALSRSAPMFTSPSFTSEGVEHAHASIVAARSSATESPATLAHDGLAELVYPSPHPYGVPVDGGASKRLDARAIDKLLEPFRDQNVAADRVSVVCVGDFKSESITRVFEKMLAKLPPKSSAPAPVFPAVPPKGGGKVVVIDRPGAGQTNVAIGWPGPKAGADEGFPLEVLAQATAGDLSTRLNLHVRKELGATYGVHMHVFALRDSGYVRVTAAIDTPRTVDALRALFVEVERLRKEPLSDAELAAAKLRTHFDLEHGTAYGLARTLANAIGHGLPPTYVTTFNARVDAVSAEDVRAAAASRLTKEELRVVVVGDASKILEGVKSLSLGEVVVRR